MSSEWSLFFTANTSAVFGLLGALGGGTLSFLASLALKKREFNLQIRGKLLDRQIAAHENILTLAIEMRKMVSLGTVNEFGEVRGGPQIMRSQEDFETWFTRFTELQSQRATWLSTTTKREVNFVQDYLVTLHMHLANIPSNKYFELGELIRQDFIDLSASLERSTFAFFEKGVRQSKPDSLSAWHKYKLPVTKRRLANTVLVQQSGAFENVRQQAQHAD